MARPLQIPCLTELGHRTDLWPLWPYLPIKRSATDGWPELGFLIDSDDGLWFCRGCLFLTAKDSELRKISEEDVVALQVEGWRVD